MTQKPQRCRLRYTPPLCNDDPTAMHEDLIITLTALGLLGALSQWFAWWVKLPAILFLLLTGIVAGPVTGWLDPDAVFGPLLFPLVSLSVAVILFEGSLTLRFSEIKGLERVVRNMVTIGALVTWGIIATATHYLMGFDWPLSLLFGALVVVTGPTVIVPMLRTVRPNIRIANILRWEGIIIDPLGAVLAVLVFEFILASQHGKAELWHILFDLGKIIAGGLLFGAVAGQTLGVALRRHWIPEYLQSIVTLSLVFLTFVAANHFQEESGLLAVTLMGVWMANMRRVPIEDILNFKETLSILLISGLFIILAARIDASQLQQLGWGAVGVLLVIQFIARPVKVWLSTLGSTLNWRERALLGWIAPRGIVAAAVSALFALKLESAGFAQATTMVSLTFLVIIGTVVLQSATARPLALWLGVAEPEPRGLLIIGANKVARAIAHALTKQGFRVLLTDSHWPNVKEALLSGLEAFWGNAISARADRNLDLVGIGKLLGLSQNDHLNVLAVQKYAPEFGRNAVYALPPPRDRKTTDIHTAAEEQRGNILFGEDVTYARLASALAAGGEIKATTLSEEFDYDAYLAAYNGRVIPLFAISKKGNLRIFSDPEHNPTPQPGWTVISLILPKKEKEQNK